MHIRPSELELSGLESVRLLNHLDLDADLICDGEARTGRLLGNVIRSPTGPEDFFRYWRFLERLVPTECFYVRFTSNVIDPRCSHRMGVLMNSLEEAED